MIAPDPLERQRQARHLGGRRRDGDQRDQQADHRAFASARSAPRPAGLAQSLKRPFPERVGEALAVGVGAQRADGGQVEQRRQQAGARVGCEAARGVRRARVVGGELAGRVVRGGSALAVGRERGAQPAPHAAKGGVGARAIHVVQLHLRLGGAPAGGRERVARVGVQPEARGEHVQRAHQQADALERVGRGRQQRAHELAVGFEHVVDGGELVGAEAAELGAVFVDLDAGHDRRGARGAEPVAQPAFEGERGRVAGRVPADAEVVAAPRPVDVALEEPAVDLARVLPGADGGEQRARADRPVGPGRRTA